MNCNLHSCYTSSVTTTYFRRLEIISPRSYIYDPIFPPIVTFPTMSERKVLTKYFPPDFDPSKITRSRAPKNAGPKVQTVRLMAPFPMKCTACGEYIYKGRKFNARKETTEEKYYAISIYRFYIRCTRCSGEITFKTDPKNMATALRVPPENWPSDREAFRLYWDDAVSKLEVTEEAKGVAKDVLEQKGLPWGLTWAYLSLKAPVSRPLTIEMLPEYVRNKFGIPSTTYTRQMFKLITSVNAAVIPWLPVSVREFPKNYYMADMRKRIASGSRL